MHDAAFFHPAQASSNDPSSRTEQLAREIEHAAHLLPTQGPITVFVHHNTLHAFEDSTFDEAVMQGLATYGCSPFLSEETYRQELSRGRIHPDDIAAVLIDELADEADQLINFLGTRYHLRMAMLEHPLLWGTASEVRWLIAETDALVRFRPGTPDLFRKNAINQTRQWVMQNASDGQNDGDPRAVKFAAELIGELFKQFNGLSSKTWSDDVWESFTLNLLWRICHQGVHALPKFAAAELASHRHRDALLAATGDDLDEPVHELLIRFCSSFLDQGLANWSLPCRERGFFRSFLALYRGNGPIDARLRGLSSELARIEANKIGPLESIDESLRLLGVDHREREEYIARTLLALRGWAGMLWQMETNAEWTVRPAPRGTLVEYLAVRLILERLALGHLAARHLGRAAELASLRSRLQRKMPHAPLVDIDQRTYLVFQLAQVRGWTPVELHRLSKEEWTRLVLEIEKFSGVERRRIYHLAYERRYRNRALDAFANHCVPLREKPREASFQIVTCIDDREESFRRHLEEIDPGCQTFGAAGFFGVPIYYQGAADAHFRPLCPVVIKPRHYVRESVAYSLTASSRQRAETRRTLGAASRQMQVQSRKFLGGMITALLGSVASIPIVTRILFPRMTARFRNLVGGFLRPPTVTELILRRTADPPGPQEEQLGFSLDEMANSVERVLRDMGLARNFASIVLFLGHGSGSLNNPHESAYNCGACSGGRGGPNARAYAQMANTPEVRRILLARGLEIPASTIFIGAFHNTCDEDVTFFDLDRIPIAHRKPFEAVRDVIDEARARNAHERSRRFESADLNFTPQQALEHVQTRAEDLSQARPEYNHATNALCVVGRRMRTCGLFLDRRAFLAEYDPTQDDAQHTILTRILAQVIPVCAGISLEYYFSCVDVAGYGCGSKLPHNIVSLLGVMEGAASDLRTGLSQQMIEIHEPIRLLFVVETTPDAILQIMGQNPAIQRHITKEWVQFAVVDPESQRIHYYRRGKFVLHYPEMNKLPRVPSSFNWYAGERDHLGFAAIHVEERVS